MYFSRIRHRNFCMLSPHFAWFQKFSAKYSRKKFRSSPGNASLVSKAFEHVSQKSYFAALEEGPSGKFQRGNSTPSSERDCNTGGLGGSQARLQEERISEEASDLICRSRRQNSELAWRKSTSWYSRKETDLFSSNVNEIVDYLTDWYKQGLQYRTANNHRSAISAFMNRCSQNMQENIPDCVLCQREFWIAGYHNGNTVSFGMSKQW